MGGNVSIQRNNQTYKADKIDLNIVDLDKFKARFKLLFLALSHDFNNIYGYELWPTMSIIDGKIFNGSTSYIMDYSVSNADILKYKSLVGDIDVTVDENFKNDLWDFLHSIEGTSVGHNITYIGSNKSKRSSIGNQMNCIFQLEYEEHKINCQVDFEFVPFENGLPTEWALFSHNSTFVDAKRHIKAVNHKYLLRALVGSMSVRPDIAIATASSRLGKVTLSKSVRDREARMLKFSVGRGLREAYEPILDKNDKILYMDGKYIYKMTDSKKSNYITSLEEMVKKIFDVVELQDEDVQDFKSFTGLMNLMTKYASKEHIQHTHDRYINLLWKPHSERAQELEANEPALDLAAKLPAYKEFVKHFGLDDLSSEYTKVYYQDYGKTRKSSVVSKSSE